MTFADIVKVILLLLSNSAGRSTMLGTATFRPLMVGAMLLALLATGCVSAPSAGDPANPTPFLAQQKPEPGSRIGASRKPFNFVYRTDAAMLTQIRSSLSGKTILVWDKGHGTQVEYYAANGRSYLWYAGNSSIVSGSWTVAVQSRKNIYGTAFPYAVVCTKYGADTYNPVTHATGATPDCTNVTDYKIYTEELAPGDPFRLASGRVPFVLTNDGAVPTLDKLYTEANGAKR